MSRKKRDERRQISRRGLIKWSAAAGAVLGLPRWKVFESLELAGGKALAADAACHPTARSVHIVAGIGGFAWFQLLWPHNDVAAAGNNTFAFHAPGQQTMAEGTEKPLTLAPETPWKDLSGRRQVSAFMAGSNETHTETPATSSTIDTNVSLFAAAAALQTTNPTLIPTIAIDTAPYGDAAGAPRVTRVGAADQLVDLFGSAASRVGGALSNKADAELFDAHYKALLAMNAAAGTPSTLRPFATGKTASKLLGTNLANLLRPSTADLARYGVDAGTPTKLSELAKSLIVAVKAFAMGLTSSLIIPAMRDDPHGAFNDMATLRSTLSGLGSILNGFRSDMQATDDPSCAGASLWDNVVLSIHGDTPKNPLNRSGWPDGTPGNANWMYVMGAGYLKSGWFGGIDRSGTVTAFNPETGQSAGNSSAATAQAASAAVAYAIAKGDMRRVQEFYRGVDIAGIVHPDQM